MNTNNITDKELTRLFNKDAANHHPEEAVRERLEYAFMVKSRNYKTTQNSFVGLFVWIFSWSHLPLKATLVSVVLLLSLFNIQNVEDQMIMQQQDTTLNMMPFHIDSSETSPLFADTCFLSKSPDKNGSLINNDSQKEEQNFSLFKLTKMKFSSGLDNKKTFVLPTPFVLPDLRISKRKLTTDSDNTALFESRLLA